MKSKPKRAAVIDIGSNTIKLLVATRNNRGQLETVTRKTMEVRIGKGLNSTNPVFPPKLINQAAETVESLRKEAAKWSPHEIRIVATSAVRDSLNRDDFSSAIRKKTGVSLQILSGEEEAAYIGSAIQADPAIKSRDFYLFDLGGGSLEAISFQNGSLQNLVSLPLGCVRLAEKLVADPKAPFTKADEQAVANTVSAEFKNHGFPFNLPREAITIGTGGTFTISLQILAAQNNKSLGSIPHYLSRENLTRLRSMIGDIPFSKRLEIPGLSPGRADVFPTALTTVLTILDITQKPGLHHSLFNLRFGIADEIL